jgi:alpha-N-acetylglucosamine transferase
VKDIRMVEKLKVPPTANMYQDKYAITGTKMHLWKMEEYSKILFLDSDMIILQNIDDYFRYELAGKHD